MRQLSHDELRSLLAAHESPCISLYQPTHRRHPENQQDPIRFRNLVKDVEASLRQGFPTRDIQPLLEPFRALADDSQFWNHATEGLAVFGCANTFRVYSLQRPVPELVVVAESFHVKPLVRILQSADRYQVLGLDRHEARLFEGNRDALDEIDQVEGVPRTITEVLGEEWTTSHTNVSFHGAGSEGGAVHQGHGSKNDVVDADAGRFFRAVDRAVLEHHSRPSGLPLILASLPEHHDVFRKLSHNPFLIAEAVDFAPPAKPDDRLREAAWRLMEPRHHERLAKLVSDFEEARSKFLGTADLTDAAQAAVAGRIGTLLVEADRQIPGKLDPATGRTEFSALDSPKVDDLLDDLAEFVLKTGGDVVVVPAALMPTQSGLAAIYRF